MIRINLLPVKRKRKAKPLPTLVVTAVLLAVFFGAVLVYCYFYFNSRLEATAAQFETNKQRVTELKKTIREVEDYEKLNKTFADRNALIEQLRKNQNIPVMILDEMSKSLPNGLWLQSMTVGSDVVSIEGYAFSNSDVVSYVDNLKNSKRFSEVYLQETKQAEVEKIPVYQFKLTFKVVG
jgi:type IV pilus assembly protein PilN